MTLLIASISDLDHTTHPLIDYTPDIVERWMSPALWLGFKSSDRNHRASVFKLSRLVVRGSCEDVQRRVGKHHNRHYSSHSDADALFVV